MNQKTYQVQIGESLEDITVSECGVTFSDATEKEARELIRLALTYGKSFTVESNQ